MSLTCEAGTGSLLTIVDVTLLLGTRTTGCGGCTNVLWFKLLLLSVRDTFALSWKCTFYSLLFSKQIIMFILNYWYGFIKAIKKKNINWTTNTSSLKAQGCRFDPYQQVCTFRGTNNQLCRIVKYCEKTYTY